MTEILKNSDNIAQTIAKAVKFNDIVEINKNQELKIGTGPGNASAPSSSATVAVQPSEVMFTSMPFDGYVILGFNIPKITLYLVIGFVLILVAYYFYNAKNKSKEDDTLGNNASKDNTAKEGKKKKNKKNNLVKD